MHKESSFMESRSVTYKNIEITSPDFLPGNIIPEKYTCNGENQSPALKFKTLPDKTQSLAIIVDDPDAPGGTWVHWVIWNIPITHYLREAYGGGVEGLNDFGRRFYCGPCPPVGQHRYNFKVYALDCVLPLAAGAKRNELEKAMSGHILGFGELVGVYKRS